MTRLNAFVIRIFVGTGAGMLLFFLVVWMLDFSATDSSQTRCVIDHPEWLGNRPKWPLSIDKASKSIPAGRREKPYFRGLGDLQGGSFYSAAFDVSDDGSVVIGRATSQSGDEAFRWTPTQGMIGLGFNGAAGISADREVVVGYRFRHTYTEAVRWTKSDGLFILAEQPTYTHMDAYAVSADGSVVAGSLTDREGRQHAYRWSANDEKIQMLGQLPGGDEGVARAVSADGSIVVGRCNGKSGRNAFRWTHTTGMVILSALPDESISEAKAISNDGTTIVGRSGNEACLWTNPDTVLGLGDLAGGGLFSVANDVTADGRLVVGMCTSKSGPEAFLWDAAHGMRCLQHVLESRPGLAEKLSGWRLKTATSVSADGDVVVGFGTNPKGNTEAWIACLSAD